MANESLIAENERLREALKQYADENNWARQFRQSINAEIWKGGFDGFSLAQKVLNEIQSKESDP